MTEVTELQLLAAGSGRHPLNRCERARASAVLPRASANAETGLPGVAVGDRLRAGKRVPGLTLHRPEGNGAAGAETTASHLYRHALAVYD